VYYHRICDAAAGVQRSLQTPGRHILAKLAQLIRMTKNPLSVTPLKSQAKRLPRCQLDSSQLPKTKKPAGVASGLS
tara:strand:+ start:1869 stop:2096 length:228 start_codon:yes stop_codon:yes gene_type:complete